MKNIRQRILISIFLTCFLNIFSQNKKVDSLKSELKTHTKDDTIKVDLLNNLAFMSFQSNLELTKLYMSKAEDLSNDLNYIKGKAKVLYLKGILESRKSNYKKSLLFFKRSLNYYETIQDKEGISVIYNAFGITHFDQSQYEKAIISYKKALEIDAALGNEIGVITSLINIGNAYCEIGRYLKAISNYKKALKKSKTVNDEEGISYVNSNLALVYKAQGNYSKAIYYFYKGLDYDKKSRDTLGIAHKLNNLGDIYKSLGKYNKALDSHKKSLKLSLQKENKSLIAINNGNIGNIYKHKKEYIKALRYYNTSLETSQEINSLKQISICFNNIGTINLLLHKPLIARENFIKAKDISQEIDHKYGLSANFLGISETYLYEKKYRKALSFAKKGKRIAEDLELLENKKAAAYLLFRIYKITRNYKKSLESHQQFKIFNDSIFNKENVEKIAQLEAEFKYKRELDSASIRELKLTRKVTATSNDLEKSQQKLLLGVIAFLLITLILGVIIFSLKLRNIKSQNQNILIEQKLLRSQMTPHFIFNALSVLQGMILNKKERKSVSYLSKFSKLLRVILENSRDKIVFLSQELTAIESYLALQNLENELYVYTVLVDETVDGLEFKIPPMLIQPFVENAIEHGFESQKENRVIDIHVSYVKRSLICTITDNGVGINNQKEKKKQYKKSLSTTITSERLKILSKYFKTKGSITIEDRQKYNEQGTIVTLIIPYKISIV